MKKRFFVYLGALLLLASAALTINGLTRTYAADVDNSPDCDTVAIIKCGAFSKNAVLNKMHGDVTETFAALGISKSDVKNAHFVSGIVWRDGRVTVNGKTVATNAMTASRNYKCAHRITSGTCTMSPRHFVTAGQTALVAMKNGSFQFAVIKPCGNPVKATPKKKPQPKPVYACTDLTKTKIDRDTYRFRASATAKNGAKVTGYHFYFGDGHNKKQDSATVKHSFAKAGEHTVTVKALVKVGDKTKAVSGKHCSLQLTVKPKPKTPLVKVCNPETGDIVTVPKDQADQYAPVDSPKCQPKPQPKPTCETKPEMAKCQPEKEELPEAGPTGLISGALGLGTLGSAGYYFRDSRRQLLAKLLKR
ncbi:MAG TPA: PKD domain-containing protein [Candidatus Saccharimonadales bacterium]|nr:PKD domain-containing protein [Candidatus Saccharimonadales bacterium]